MTEILTETRAEKARADRQLLKSRSAVTTGRSAFLPESSSTLCKERRYRDILANLVSDLGGADHLTEAQQQIARRAVSLSLQCEHWDAAAVVGQPVDWDLYGRTSNTLRRLLESLGLERVAKPAETLEGYLERNYSRDRIE
jgi:hypothetical protein